jgi:MoxR-like ATPase
VTSTTFAGKEYDPVTLGNGDGAVTVLVPAPDAPAPTRFVGQGELVRRCRAAWLDTGRGPLAFRLVGPPGVGKNALVYHLAREVERKPLYILQGHEELTPEDIACTARVTPDNRVQYVGSPLLAAMLTGGILFFDELGKVPARALALLASVLDDRRTITSVLAGFTVAAHPGFRFAAALNDADAAAGGLPGFLDERLRPVFKVGYPSHDELREIVRTGAGDAHDRLLDALIEWARGLDPKAPGFSPRQGIAIVSYAARLLRLDPGTGESVPSASTARALIRAAAAAVRSES